MEILIERGQTRCVLFPGAVVHQSLLVHVLFQQAVELVVINSGTNIDIFASLRARSQTDREKAGDEKKDPKFVHDFSQKLQNVRPELIRLAFESEHVSHLATAPGGPLTLLNESRDVLALVIDSFCT